MKFVFIIQGEGRGHLTQAISMKNILVSAGHTIGCVCVGKSERRIIPAFFHEKIGVPVHAFESPNFVADAHNKGIQIGKTIAYNLKKFPVFLKSLHALKKIIDTEKPDVIINFYDFLGGIYNLLYKKKSSRFYVIGHQYFLEHSSFQFPENSRKDRNILLTGNKITALRADKKLALSFRNVPDEKDKKIMVVPPLLRREVKELKTENGNFILAYVNMPGYGDEIRLWCETHPETEVHCFWDKKEHPDGWQPLPNLTFHHINDLTFMEMMRKCRGYVSTAGFESICEAMYLGKPVLMIPIEGQFEQTCNAIDAILSGAGTSADSFNISKLLDYLPQHQDKQDDFRKWLANAEQRFLSAF
jgi:uncharacterized protein (TIGR00661 family)